MKYLIIIEPTDTGFSAYSPDLPGCVSAGATRQEVERNMREAIQFHVEGLQLEGIPVPESLVPPSNPDAEEAWMLEAERRWKEIENGVVKTIPWERFERSSFDPDDLQRR